MFKTLLLVASLLAAASARPGYIHSAGPVLTTHTLDYAVPSYTVHQPLGYAKIGAIVKSIPTAVSHQSQSIVHSSAHVVQPIVAPVVKTSYIAAAPAPLLVKPVHSGWDAWSPSW